MFTRQVNAAISLYFYWVLKATDNLFIIYTKLSPCVLFSSNSRMSAEQI